jgi:hypothetical protein
MVDGRVARFEAEARHLLDGWDSDFGPMRFAG